MRYPKFLPEKGTIGFVAPSFGCATEPYYTAFLNAQKKFQKMGYGLDLGPNCYEAKGIGISNTPQACGKELTDYYCSVDNDILISCGGGEMMCETMNFVDFEKIKSAAPKWYMGYSDNTNFTFLLSTICDTAAVYGPCAGTFGMEPWHESLFDTMEVLTGKRTKLHSYPFWEKDDLIDEGNPYVPYNTTEPLNLVLYTGAENPDAVVTMEGRLVGGCVDCLVNLLGTQFDYVNHIVVGIGINVHNESFPKEIEDVATSIYLQSGEHINRARLIEEILEQFERYYAIYLKTEDLSGLVNEYNSRLVNMQQKVRVLDPNEPYEGKAMGITGRGELIVDTWESRKLVSSGEVSVRGIYGYV